MNNALRPGAMIHATVTIPGMYNKNDIGQITGFDYDDKVAAVRWKTDNPWKQRYGDTPMLVWISNMAPIQAASALYE